MKSAWHELSARGVKVACGLSAKPFALKDGMPEAPPPLSSRRCHFTEIDMSFSVGKRSPTLTFAAQGVGEISVGLWHP